jgi:hypothetical protein
MPLREPYAHAIRALASLLLRSELQLQRYLMVENPFVHSLVAIVVAGVATACTNNDNARVCEYGWAYSGYPECATCAKDEDCGSASQPGEVCASDATCWPPNELRTVTVNWTIGGQPANVTTCSALPNELTVEFWIFGGANDTFSFFSPVVPCTAGTVVKNRVPPGYTNFWLVGDNQTLAQTSTCEDDFSLDIPSP